MALGVVCTLATGAHRELFEIARPGFERFAVAHRRDLVVGHDDVAGGRHPGWGKVPLLRELVDAYDEVVWVDADAVVLDPDPDPVAELARHQALGLVFHRYDGMEVPNFGVLTMRSCRWSKRFLERLWRAERYLEHPWWENAAVLEFLGYEVAWPRRETRRFTPDSLRVGRLDRSWNSIPVDPAPVPRIAHFPGMGHDARVAAMREHAAAVRTF